MVLLLLLLLLCRPLLCAFCVTDSSATHLRDFAEHEGVELLYYLLSTPTAVAFMSSNAFDVLLELLLCGDMYKSTTPTATTTTVPATTATATATAVAGAAGGVESLKRRGSFQQMSVMPLLMHLLRLQLLRRRVELCEYVLELVMDVVEAHAENVRLWRQSVGLIGVLELLLLASDTVSAAGAGAVVVLSPIQMQLLRMLRLMVSFCCCCCCCCD